MHFDLEGMRLLLANLLAPSFTCRYQQLCMRSHCVVVGPLLAILLARSPQEQWPAALCKIWLRSVAPLAIDPAVQKCSDEVAGSLALDLVVFCWVLGLLLSWPERHQQSDDQLCSIVCYVLVRLWPSTLWPETVGPVVRPCR